MGAIMAAGAIGAAAIGPAISGAFGLGGSAMQASFLKKQQEDAQDFWKYQTVSGPGLQRQGLEDAGYNPLMALGMKPMGTAPAIGGGISNPLEAAANSAKDLGLKYEQIKMQKQQIKTQTQVEKGASADADIKTATANFYRRNPKLAVILDRMPDGMYKSAVTAAIMAGKGQDEILDLMSKGANSAQGIGAELIDWFKGLTGRKGSGIEVERPDSGIINKGATSAKSVVLEKLKNWIKGIFKE